MSSVTIKMRGFADYPCSLHLRNGRHSPSPVNRLLEGRVAYPLLRRAISIAMASDSRSIFRLPFCRTKISSSIIRMLTTRGTNMGCLNPSLHMPICTFIAQQRTSRRHRQVRQVPNRDNNHVTFTGMRSICVKSLYWAAKRRTATPLFSFVNFSERWSILTSRSRRWRGRLLQSPVL